MSNFFSNLFIKLKSIKHIEIILAVLFGLIILLVYFSSISADKQEQTTQSEVSSTVSNYATNIENKMEQILSKINGVGEVNVMIMLEDSVSSEGDTMPTISSVIVVAEGAENIGVKLEIIKALETLLKLDAGNIEVLIGGG